MPTPRNPPLTPQVIQGLHLLLTDPQTPDPQHRKSIAKAAEWIKKVRENYLEKLRLESPGDYRYQIVEILDDDSTKIVYAHDDPDAIGKRFMKLQNAGMKVRVEESGEERCIDKAGRGWAISPEIKFGD